jgi:hypothetical protein
MSRPAGGRQEPGGERAIRDRKVCRLAGIEARCTKAGGGVGSGLSWTNARDEMTVPRLALGMGSVRGKMQPAVSLRVGRGRADIPIEWCLIGLAGIVVAPADEEWQGT